LTLPPVGRYSREPMTCMKRIDSRLPPLGLILLALPGLPGASAS